MTASPFKLVKGWTRSQPAVVSGVLNGPHSLYPEINVIWLNASQTNFHTNEWSPASTLYPLSPQHINGLSAPMWAADVNIPGLLADYQMT